MLTDTGIERTVQRLAEKHMSSREELVSENNRLGSSAREDLRAAGESGHAEYFEAASTYFTNLAAIALIDREYDDQLDYIHMAKEFAAIPEKY